MGAQPADRGLAVLNLGREDGVLAQAVVDGGHSVSLAEVFHRHTLFPCCPLGSKFAAVDVNDQRQIRAVLRQIQVQLLARVAAG